VRYYALAPTQQSAPVSPILRQALERRQKREQAAAAASAARRLAQQQLPPQRSEADVADLRVAARERAMERVEGGRSRSASAAGRTAAAANAAAAPSASSPAATARRAASSRADRANDAYDAFLRAALDWRLPADAAEAAARDPLWGESRLPAALCSTRGGSALSGGLSAAAASSSSSSSSSSPSASLLLSSADGADYDEAGSDDEGGAVAVAAGAAAAPPTPHQEQQQQQQQPQPQQPEPLSEEQLSRLAAVGAALEARGLTPLPPDLAPAESSARAPGGARAARLAELGPDAAAAAFDAWAAATTAPYARRLLRREPALLLCSPGALLPTLEALVLHLGVSPQEARELAAEHPRVVGLSPQALRARLARLAGAAGLSPAEAASLVLRVPELLLMPAEVLAARVDALEALLPSSAPDAAPGAAGGGGGDASSSDDEGEGGWRGAASASGGGGAATTGGRLPAVLMRRPRVLLRSPAAVARLVSAVSEALGLRAREVARVVAGQPTLLGSGPETLARRYRRLLALAGAEPSGAWARCLGSMSPSGLGRCLAASDAALDRLQALLDARASVVSDEAAAADAAVAAEAEGGLGPSPASASLDGPPRGRRVRIRSGVVWLDDMKALLALPRGAFAQVAEKLGVALPASAAGGLGVAAAVAADDGDGGGGGGGGDDDDDDEHGDADELLEV
jgi:hypothetical protein